MKILILGFTKVKYMPYLNLYLDNIDREKHEVHLLYWNRDLKQENLVSLENIKLHEFLFYQEDDVSKHLKIKAFFKYRQYALKILKNQKFDFIIILHSLPGVLIFDKLEKFKGNYILDYRDSTYEKFEFFKKIIGRIVKNSYVTFVSSDGFRNFLPKDCQYKIFISHNLLIDSLNHREDKDKYGLKSNKIRIAFWGFIRHEALNIQIIDNISKDRRFELHYYGREQKTAWNLKRYVKQNNIKNVFFHGEYQPEERYAFIQQTDMIHNIYHDDNMMVAVGNKYYDGIVFRIPQLCMTNSFMGKKVRENGLGLEVNPYDNNFIENIFTYYKNLEMDVFKKHCNNSLEVILKEIQEITFLIKNIQKIHNNSKYENNIL